MGHYNMFSPIEVSLELNTHMGERRDDVSQTPVRQMIYKGYFLALLLIQNTFKL